MDNINELKQQLLRRPVAGLTHEHGGALVNHVTPDDIVGLAVRDWLARTKDPNVVEITPEARGDLMVYCQLTGLVHSEALAAAIKQARLTVEAASAREPQKPPPAKNKAKR
jgi:hypothetical protein